MLICCMPAKKYFNQEELYRRQKFCAHKGVAKQRGIPFHFTFEEWCNIWDKSGHWDERGNRRGKYCMSRYEDKGAYEIGNVFIQLWTQNTSDAHKGKIKSEATKQKIREKRKLQVVTPQSRSKTSATMSNRLLSCVKCRRIFGNQRHFTSCKG